MTATDSRRHDARSERFPSFVRKHEPALRAFVSRRVGSNGNPDDIAQDVFLVAWHRFDHITSTVPPSSELAWLCGVAIRMRAHELRAAGRRERMAARYAVDRTRPEHERQLRDAFGSSDDRDLAERLLARLNDDDRTVLLAVLWDGLSTEEVAVMLECSPQAARKRISRAYQRARELQRAEAAS